MGEGTEKEKYAYYEDELLAVLEDALDQENRAHQFYLAAAGRRPWQKEAKEMLLWLSGEEAKHARLITERLDEVRRRLKAIHYKVVPD